MSDTKQKITFEEIQRWARDDSALLRRDVIDGVNEVVGQNSVKLKLIAMAVARAQINRFQKFAEQLDQIEVILFDPERIKHMKNNQLIALLDVLHKRQSGIADTIMKTAAASGELHVTPDELETFVDQKVDQKITPEIAANVISKIGMLTTKVQAQQGGFVPRPPVL